MRVTKLLPWLMGKIHRKILYLLLMILVQAAQALLAVQFALGTRQVIDLAIAGNASAFGRACLRQAALVVGLLVCIAVSRFLKEWLASKLEIQWKQQLLHKILLADYQTISGFHSAELMNRLNQDVQAVNDGLLIVVPGLVSTAVRLLAAVAVLSVLDGRFTAVLVILGCLTVCATGALRKHYKMLQKAVRAQDGKVYGFLQEAIENLLVVQALDVAGEMERRADAVMQMRYEVQKKRRTVALTANLGVSVLSYGIVLVSLLWCAAQVLHGAMTVGTLTAVTQLVNQLRTPFIGLSGVISKYTASIASAERLMELTMACGDAEEHKKSGEALYRSASALAAKHVSFSYDRDPVLTDVSFRLPKGSFSVVAGPSGIGKSTLLKLLLGIFAPESGELLLECGGEAVPLDCSTRGLFAYVPQGNLLFSGTLRENLCLTKPNASEAELRQAMAVSCLDSVVAQLPEGLETQLGENAHGLSEGQAQRLSIARAVLSGAPILLLDEVTSALDAETEAQVLRNLKALPDRTCIAVTHRPAAVELADWHLLVDAAGIRCVRNGET